MTPPVFSLLSTDAGVAALVGPSPFRIFRGTAPQGSAYPYVAWTTVAGMPENYLGDRPDMDHYRVQLNCWDKSEDGADALFEAVKAVMEGSGYMVAFLLDGRDAETRNWRQSADFSLWVPRS